MSPNLILVLQSIGVTVQMINAAIGTVTHEPVVAILVASVAGGFQFFLQRIGNQSDPSK